MKHLFIALGVAVLATACSESTTTSPTVTPVEETVTMEMADAGKVVFDKKCTTCHGAKVIKDYTKDQWSKILPNMAKKAELTPEQTASVSNYVQWELRK